MRFKPTITLGYLVVIVILTFMAGLHLFGLRYVIAVCQGIDSVKTFAEEAAEVMKKYDQDVQLLLRGQAWRDRKDLPPASFQTGA